MDSVFRCVVALILVMVVPHLEIVKAKQDFTKTKNYGFSLEERNLLALGKILQTLEKMAEPQAKCDKEEETNEKLQSLISTVENTQNSVKIIAESVKNSITVYKAHQSGKYWPASQCHYLRSPADNNKNAYDASLETCKADCNSNSNCTAIHYKLRYSRCELKNCPIPAPEPIGSNRAWIGYSIYSDTSAKFETILTEIKNAQNSVEFFAKSTADAITKLQHSILDHIPASSHTEMTAGTTTPVPIHSTVNSDLCESPYFLVGGECFRIGSYQKDWTSAKLQCQSEGADLAAPEDLDLLRQHLLDSGDEADYWIGGHGDDGTWTWITGDPIPDEWMLDQPSRRTGEDCLDFRVSHGRWPALNDYYCWDTQRYLCERLYTGTAPPTPEPVDCSRVGAINVGQKCLTISEDLLNWHEANNACIKKGGQLASLQGKRDPDLVHDYIFANHRGLRFWLGGSDIANEGHWVWMNGQPIQHFPWRDPQPDNAHGGQDCLVWGYGSHFDDTKCESSARYICEIDVSSTNATTSEPQTEEASMQDLVTEIPLDIDCSTSKGHIRVGQKCLIFASVMKNWTDAVASCANNSGQLVTLAKRSDAENLDEYIQSHFDNQRFWLGGSDVDNEGKWVWITGDQFENFPWHSPQPDNHSGDEDCLEWGYRSHFNDHKCIDLRRYICEFDTLPTVTETSGTEPDTAAQDSVTETPLHVSSFTDHTHL